jgi:polygalacturonase
VKRSLHLAAALLAAGAGARTHAAGHRKVVEPTPPPACVVLTAGRDGAPGGDDTARIQSAIDACPAGRAVRLSGAFVTGPLKLRSGVSLLIAGARAASQPQSQTVRPRRQHLRHHRQIRPRLQALHHHRQRQASGIYGEGSIDGQAAA